MKRILLINECKQNNLAVKFRKASRAIMFKEDKLVMIQSKKYGEYKFPGGGCKSGEVLKQTLVREVLEETGLDVLPSSIKEFGKVEEWHIDTYDSSKMFNNISYYYLCDFIDNGKTRNMDEYEIEYGYEVRYVSVDEAIKQNQLVLYIGPTWVKREIEVLKYIKKHFSNRKELFNE